MNTVPLLHSAHTLWKVENLGALHKYIKEMHGSEHKSPLINEQCLSLGHYMFGVQNSQQLNHQEVEKAHLSHYTYSQIDTLDIS